MTFVTTSLAVAGLVAVMIPIAIHLLSRQRRRPIQWAAMRFLIEAYRKQRRRLRLEQLLLLTVRCLIVLLLGAALAQPLLRHTGLLNTTTGRVIYLIIDNGLVSSLRDSSDETALARHITQAGTIIDALDPADRIGIITAARPVQGLVTPPTSDHAAVWRLLRELQPQDSPSDIPGALALLSSVITADDTNATTEHFAYLLSEFRSGSAPLDAPLPSLLGELDDKVTLLAAPPAEQSAANVTITEIDPVRHVVIPGAADGSGQITVRLARSGSTLDADISRVRLHSRGLGSIQPRTVHWEPGQSHASVDFLLPLAEQSNDDELTLTAQLDDDAINADNTRHAVLALRNRIRVVMLERRAFGFESRLDRLTAGQWIARALDPVEAGPLQIIEVEPAALSVADLRAADVVIASRPDLVSDDSWNLLRAYVDRGGLLLISPPGQLNVHQWAERFTTTMSLPWRIGPEVQTNDQGIALADEQPRSELLRLLMGDLDDLVQPVLSTRLLPVQIQDGQGTTLLRYDNGMPMVLAASPHRPDNTEDGPDDSNAASQSQGLIILFTTAPELTWTNLPSKPLMVPLVHELVRQGLSSIRANQRIIAGEQPALARHPSATDLIAPEGQRIAITNARPLQPLTKVGLYELRDAASNPLAHIAVNIDPASARVDAQPANAVLAWLSGSGPWTHFANDQPAGALRQITGSASLAGVLLAIVLALVLLETLLARWFSYSVEGEGPITTSSLQPTIHQNISSVHRAGGAA